MRYEILSYHMENRVMTINLHDNGKCYADPAQVANELYELSSTDQPSQLTGLNSIPRMSDLNPL